MDPLRPVDPDEELPQEAADRPAANDSDVEPPVDIQSTAAQELPPVDDKFALADDPRRADLDSIPLPTASDATATIAGSTSPERAAITSSNDATPEPPAPSQSALSASASADTGPDAENILAVEPVDAIPPDVIQPLSNRRSDSSVDLSAPQHVGPEPTIDPPDFGIQTSPPSSAIDSVDVHAATAPVDSIADYLRPVVDPEALHERRLDDGGKPRDEPVADAKDAPSESQPEPAPVERKEEAYRREAIERFIENFNEQSARSHALLSPGSDGGPPMARPIVLVSLAEEEMQAITNEALAESGSQLAKTAAEIAEDKVNEAFWLRDCEMRALYRGR